MKLIGLLLSFVTILFVTMLACSMPVLPELAKASTPPPLPAYSTPTPTATPVNTPPIRMEPGDSLILTDSEGKYVWVEYLGNSTGYDIFNCRSNSPERENDCKGADLEVHQTFIKWGGKTIAWSRDDGVLRPYEGWYPIESNQ